MYLNLHIYNDYIITHTVKQSYLLIIRTTSAAEHCLLIFRNFQLWSFCLWAFHQLAYYLI